MRQPAADQENAGGGEMTRGFECHDRAEREPAEEQWSLGGFDLLRHPTGVVFESLLAQRHEPWRDFEVRKRDALRLKRPPVCGEAGEQHKPWRRLRATHRRIGL